MRREIMLGVTGAVMAAGVGLLGSEAPGLVAALKHAAAKWPSYGLPPLIALAGAAVFAIQLVTTAAARSVPDTPLTRNANSRTWSAPVESWDSAISRSAAVQNSERSRHLRRVVPISRSTKGCDRGA